MTTQATLAEIGGPAFDPNSSRLIRTSWMLNATATLAMQTPPATVRFLSESDASRLQEQIRNRHVFSRHSYERSFYIARAGELANRTVIEVTLPGDPKSMVRAARSIAALVERVAVVSTVLYHPRRRLHTDLGIRQHRKDVVDLTLGPKLGHLSGSSQREVPARGVTVDRRFVTRFNRLDLDQVVAAALTDSVGGRRIEQSLGWLLECRLDAGTAAAAIKCAIALETMLGRSDNEPLRQTLSERAAFLLSEEADTRRSVSRLVRTFYDARSAIVHGSTRRKRTRGVTVGLLEAAERIVFLVLITLACNQQDLAADDALRKWVEERRWGAPGATLRRPFRPGDLKRALERGAKQ